MISVEFLPIHSQNCSFVNGNVHDKQWPEVIILETISSYKLIPPERSPPLVTVCFLRGIEVMSSEIGTYLR